MSLARLFAHFFFASLSFRRCSPLVAFCVLLNSGKYFTAPKMFCMKICRLDVNSRFCVFVVVCLSLCVCQYTDVRPICKKQTKKKQQQRPKHTHTSLYCECLNMQHKNQR